MHKSLAAIVTLLLTVLAAPPERKGPPTPAELQGVTERGRLLAEYDDAAWNASDAIQKVPVKPGSVVRYIARKTKDGWMVDFGRLNEQGDKFLTAFEATPGKAAGAFHVKKIDPPKEDTGALRSMARAIDVAQQDFIRNFQGERRSYNVAALPAPDGQWWVYLIPAPTKVGSWPLGSDVRYRVSPDGAKIVAKRQLHNAIIEKGPPPENANQKSVASFHTHVLDDTPEDTDVFHVLVRKPAVPEIIASKNYVFQVGADGEIKYLGKAGEMLKKK